MLHMVLIILLRLCILNGFFVSLLPYVIFKLLFTDDETEELDFLSLLTNVANRVGKREIIFPPQKKTNTEVPTDDQIKKQMPSFVSTLTKSLYLPKLTRKRQK